MRPESFRSPVELVGAHVRLVPLQPSHAEALAPVWANPDVNRYLIGLVPGPDRSDLRPLVDYLLSQQARGTDLAFTTIRTSDGRPIGMTRYLHIDRPNDAVEIGGTWLDPSCWRTPCNTESKLLLLRHAFETEGVHRVCLQTDARNARSQTAIARIGAQREAVLRDDRRLAENGFRSSVFFRILRPEWPAIERSLTAKLDRPPVETGWPAAEARRGPTIARAAAAGPEPERRLPEIRLHPPVTLHGRYVALVPLDRSQIPGLAHAGRDPEIWRWLRIPPGRDEREMTGLVDEFLAGQADGSLLPFAVLERSSGAPIGMFRFLDIDRHDRKAEIGTWIDSAYWRSPVNTEVKYLGLGWAFEHERVHRVQLRTDARNVRSQRAIERLGAVREGTHDEHLRLRDGTYRTSFVYSLLAPDWPGVKARLEERLARPWNPGGRPASGSIGGS